MASETKPKKRGAKKGTGGPVVVLTRDAPLIPPGCDAMLGKAQVAHLICVSVRQLEYMISGGEFPPADVHFDRSPRWHSGTVNGWIRRKCGKE